VITLGDCGGQRVVAALIEAVGEHRPWLAVVICGGWTPRVVSAIVLSGGGHPDYCGWSTLVCVDVKVRSW
jgi:hypothetical protein